MVDKDGIKIFLIEDDPTMVSLLEILLQMENFITAKIEKEDTTLILEQINQFKPNLILLDVNLKNISGLDVMYEIRKRPELLTAKVIMTSGSDTKDQCISRGADDFIMKPYMPDKLLKMIHSQLQQ